MSSSEELPHNHDIHGTEDRAPVVSHPSEDPKRIGYGLAMDSSPPRRHCSTIPSKRPTPNSASGRPFYVYG
ncbi:hypothetical protein GCK72_000512 [Caenorhabditis remanei]|uniref:Uncharacterized protein n=1 Tax=Caenorhabditis remanei TaxID=31234 RepID=A0A6A5HM88_CAERE|nr:hypothetical protein GCK72_000512 [Caenorhabditis remanei]KAF1768699.1 hypothetical protein GCK72_000512 [Caenorhabditis remanei]